MKEYVFRLVNGDDLKQGIVTYCKEHNIKAGAVVACAGCLKEINIRTADGISLYHEVKEYEIVSLSGTIASNDVHIHISLSDASLRTIGGHLKDGCIVNTTAEIVLLAFDDIKMCRMFDESTGYDELVVED